MTFTDFRTDPSTGHSRLRLRWILRRPTGRFGIAVVAPLVLTVLLTACGGGASGELSSSLGLNSGAGRVNGSKAVIESPLFRTTAGLDRQTQIISALTEAVTTLRNASTSGWQVRQDDSTGGGAELSGGVITYPKGTAPLAAARQLLADHGDVFGFTDPLNQVIFSRPITDSTGVVTIRANQAVRGVPVEGSSLLIVVRHPLTTPEIGYAKAHVFPDLDRTAAVETRPAIDERTAVGVATQRGAVPVGQGVLVITAPETTPALAWKFDADYTPPADAPETPGAPKAGPLTVYVDAQLGTVLRLEAGGRVAIRALAGSGILSQSSVDKLKLPEKGTPVKVSGTVIGGFKVTLTLEKQPDGSIVFIDSSQPNADREKGTGLNIVFDGSQIVEERDFPGDLARMNPGDGIDPDTFTAAWAAKTVLDYYRTEFGRASWDGNGVPLLSTVHTPEAQVSCNAYFSGYTKQMTYSGPCYENGERIYDSLVDISVVGHEITHGVTSTAAPFISSNSSQGASLNEGNSDYFGLIIQNRVFGKPYATDSISTCMGREPNSNCLPLEPGVLGGRTVDSGAIVDDGVFLLRQPLGYVDRVTDLGGAHDNGMIWTNALWQIRKAFASQDGGDMVKSPAAARFDRIVYRAITNYFTNETDFPAAASAVSQAAIDLEASGAERDVIAAQFKVSQFCSGCSTPDGTAEAVALAPQMELAPIVVDGGVVFLKQTQPSGADFPIQQTFFAPTDSTKPAKLLGSTREDTISVDGKGSWLVEGRENASSAWYQLTNLATGQAEELGPWVRGAMPAVSKDTVVWPGKDGEAFTISARANKGGKVKVLTVDQQPIQMGVDGNLVAFHTADGRIQAWNLESDTVKVLDQSERPITGFLFLPGAVKVSGNNIAVLGGRDGFRYPKFVTLYDADSGSSQLITDHAFPAGLSFDGNHLVYSDVSGLQDSALARLIQHEYDDTDIVIYSVDSGTESVVVRERGQQGFPSIAGNRLAWQDSVSGGEDIYAGTLPDGF